MIKQPAPNWQLEYDKLIQQMTTFFDKNSINEFLACHLRLSQLFTHKLQYTIDNTEKMTYEYKLDANPELMKKIDQFNANLSVVIDQNKSLVPATKEAVKETKESKK